VFGPSAENDVEHVRTDARAMVVRDTTGGFKTWMYYSEFYL